MKLQSDKDGESIESIAPNFQGKIFIRLIKPRVIFESIIELDYRIDILKISLCSNFIFQI